MITQTFENIIPNYSLTVLLLYQVKIQSKMPECNIVKKDKKHIYM